jgi:hypothetical protein
MTPHGTAAVIILIITNGATAIGALISVLQWRRGITKEKHNQLIMLERWADDIQRYHHRLRAYLIGLEKQGIIDISRVDLSQFPPPPRPTINGNGGS